MTGILSEGSAEGSVPRYGARQGIRSLLPDASGRGRVPAVSLRWFGRADRKAVACSAESEQRVRVAG